MIFAFIYNNLDSLANLSAHITSVKDTLKIQIVNGGENGFDYKVIVTVILSIISLIGGYYLNQRNQNRIERNQKRDQFKDAMIKFGTGNESEENILLLYTRLSSNDRKKINITDIKKFSPDTMMDDAIKFVEKL